LAHPVLLWHDIPRLFALKVPLNTNQLTFTTFEVSTTKSQSGFSDPIRTDRQEEQTVPPRNTVA